MTFSKETGPSRTVPKRGIKRAVFDYLQAHEGEILSNHAIAAGVGISVDQVNQAASDLAIRVPNVTREFQGAYKYVKDAPEPESKLEKNALYGKSTLFEEVGILKSGDLIIRRMDGRLYRATEM